MVMITGMTIAFTQKVPSGKDSMGNDTFTDTAVSVADCLVAPITEPTTAREQQALEQSKDQVRVHFPKTFEGDVSKSTFVYGGKTFKLDSDSVPFMNANTPTRWNRYIRAESVNA
jgi:hypothetical protein